MPKKVKRKILTSVIGFLIVTAGMIALNYPYLSGVMNELFSYREVIEYEQVFENTGIDETSEKLVRAHAYNEALSSGGNLESFSDFELVQEGSFIGYVDVPQIGVYGALRYSVSEKVLKQGLGLIEKTSLPVGGPSTHAVISGHTGMASKKVLTDLTQMKVGDIFFMHVLGENIAYQVDKIVIVEPWDTSGLAIVTGEDRVTLLTCTPYGVNDHRLLVCGVRIEYDFTEPMYEEAKQQEPRVSDVERIRIYIAIGSGVIYGVFVMYLIVDCITEVSNYKKKKRKEAANAEADL